MKVEVTLQFEVDDNCELETVHRILKERVKDFNYKEEFVQWNYIIPGKTMGIIETQDKLRDLEIAANVFKESLDDIMKK